MIKIILCAFNEAQNLEKLIPSIIEQFKIMQREFEIIFCLDCTTDNSVKIIEEFSKNYPIKILPIENQRGLGIAYKKAFLYCIKNFLSDDLIISFDADCTHKPSQLPEMIKLFEEKKLDFMVASRFANLSSITHFPLYRKIISFSISIILQILFPIKNTEIKIKDYTSGYRIYRNEILQNLYQQIGDKFISENDFTCLIEILIKLNQHKLITNFIEFPIKYEYGDKNGASKMRLIYNFYRLLILSIKLIK